MAAGSKRVALLGLTVVAALIFVGLGVWQVQRLAWKTALIEQVESRAHAAPVPAPASIEGPADAYRAVRVVGRFRHDQESLVKAVTDLGPGSWVMTPLETDRGFTVLVNRGFVPQQTVSDSGGTWDRPSGRVVTSGLIRLSEPKGGFLRANDPVNNRWFSRDTEALARARAVAGPVAPYFIDAAADPASSWPRGGLTVIRFSNSHLIYALTWFGLAALALFAAWRVLRDRTRPTGDEG
ncbi:SURF1 family protein [Brevundimonas sp.]|uniref:SURF1 family protein n=1 Tax=Brevundimonas sp. TaxID=1871086 RepID=UPI0026256E1C|nr:SURF1 family protein [Brevundimonas sp.]